MMPMMMILIQMVMRWVLTLDANDDYDGDDDDAESDGDEMGLDSGFGAKLLLHSTLITKGNPASFLMMRMILMMMMMMMLR